MLQCRFCPEVMSRPEVLYEHCNVIHKSLLEECWHRCSLCRNHYPNIQVLTSHREQCKTGKRSLTSTRNQSSKRKKYDSDIEMPEDEISITEMSEDEMSVTELSDGEMSGTEMTKGEVSVAEMSRGETYGTEMPMNEMSTTEMPINEMPITEMSSGEVSTTEMFSGVMSLTEMSKAEMSTTEMPTIEMSIIEMPMNEMSTTEMSEGETTKSVESKGGEMDSSDSDKSCEGMSSIEMSASVKSKSGEMSHDTISAAEMTKSKTYKCKMSVVETSEEGGSFVSEISQVEKSESKAETTEPEKPSDDVSETESDRLDCEMLESECSSPSKDKDEEFGNGSFKAGASIEIQDNDGDVNVESSKAIANDLLSYFKNHFKRDNEVSSSQVAVDTNKIGACEHPEPEVDVQSDFIDESSSTIDTQSEGLPQNVRQTEHHVPPQSLPQITALTHHVSFGQTNQLLGPAAQNSGLQTIGITQPLSAGKTDPLSEPKSITLDTQYFGHHTVGLIQPQTEGPIAKLLGSQSVDLSGPQTAPNFWPQTVGLAQPQSDAYRHSIPHSDEQQTGEHQPPQPEPQQLGIVRQPDHDSVQHTGDQRGMNESSQQPTDDSRDVEIFPDEVKIEEQETVEIFRRRRAVKFIKINLYRDAISGWQCCADCGVFTLTDDQLEKHRRLVHVPCPEDSLTQNRLQSLLFDNIFGGLKPVKKAKSPVPFVSCKFPDYATDNSYLLSRHVRTVHNKEKPFTCTLCEYSTGMTYLLKRHQSTVHNMEKPFKCEFCAYSSNRKDKLREHIQRSHDKNQPKGPKKKYNKKS